MNEVEIDRIFDELTDTLLGNKKDATEGGLEDIEIIEED